MGLETTWKNNSRCQRTDIKRRHKARAKKWGKNILLRIKIFRRRKSVTLHYTDRNTVVVLIFILMFSTGLVLFLLFNGIEKQSFDIIKMVGRVEIIRADRKWMRWNQSWVKQEATSEILCCGFFLYHTESRRNKSEPCFQLWNVSGCCCCCCYL